MSATEDEVRGLDAGWETDEPAEDDVDQAWDSLPPPVSASCFYSRKTKMGSFMPSTYQLARVMPEAAARDDFLPFHVPAIGDEITLTIEAEFRQVPAA